VRSAPLRRLSPTRLKPFFTWQCRNECQPGFSSVSSRQACHHLRYGGQGRVEEPQPSTPGLISSYHRKLPLAAAARRPIDRIHCHFRITELGRNLTVGKSVLLEHRRLLAVPGHIKQIVGVHCRGSVLSGNADPSIFGKQTQLEQRPVADADAFLRTYLLCS
jgi:hypothetical protein